MDINKSIKSCSGKLQERFDLLEDSLTGKINPCLINRSYPGIFLNIINVSFYKILRYNWYKLFEDNQDNNHKTGIYSGLSNYNLYLSNYYKGRNCF